MQLVLDNLDQFEGQIVDWVMSVRALTREVAEGFANFAFIHVTDMGAQFTGDFVGNWRMEVGGITPKFERGLFTVHQREDPSNVRFMGHPEAINYARNNARGRLNNFHLGDTIYIHNSAEHDEPYAWKIENGQIKFREVNLGADRPVGNWMDIVYALYSEIGEKEANTLRGWRDRL
jgi:hypothetical protein